MTGMDERTGKLLGGRAWLTQAIRRTLTTPRGSLPMARGFGVSNLTGSLSPARVATTAAEAAEALEGAGLPMVTEEVRPLSAGIEAGNLRIYVRVRPLDLGPDAAPLEVRM